MRQLNENERRQLEVRRQRFEQFLAERLPVLTDFMARLELSDPQLVLVAADRYVSAVDAWLTWQVIEGDDRVWLLTRVGYLVGECLVQKFGGCWLINEVPDSAFFGRYVVGQFPGAANPDATVDPFALAASLVDQPPGRSLCKALEEVEHDIQSV
jgi:hypothetical protein